VLEASWHCQPRAAATVSTTSSAFLSWGVDPCETAERQLLPATRDTAGPGRLLRPRDFVLTSRPIQFREIRNPLLFLADWKGPEAAFPLAPAMMQSADQFATQAAERSGTQSDKLIPKVGHKLPSTYPFPAAPLSLSLSAKRIRPERQGLPHQRI
jgi:hypothetical protein